MTDLGTATGKDAAPFLQHLLDQAARCTGAERREDQRHPLSVTLRVQPLDDDLQPLGKEFRVITRDVSTGGVGFVHTSPIEQRFLRLVMADESHDELIVEVRHCTRVGELGLLYLIGVQLLERN